MDQTKAREIKCFEYQCYISYSIISKLIVTVITERVWLKDFISHVYNM